MQSEAEWKARESELQLKVQALGDALKEQEAAASHDRALRAAAELEHANEIARIHAAHEEALRLLRKRWCCAFRCILLSCMLLTRVMLHLYKAYHVVVHVVQNP